MRFVEKATFRVIGREGSTQDGPGFIQRLWAEANARFGEVAALAKKDEQGAPVGFWGAMTDMGRRNLPWEEGFTKGLYLAGVEARDDAQPPQGWVLWEIPASEYAVVENGPTAFSDAVAALNERGTPLIGAAHDFTCPKTGANYVYLPIRRL